MPFNPSFKPAEDKAAQLRELAKELPIRTGAEQEKINATRTQSAARNLASAIKEAPVMPAATEQKPAAVSKYKMSREDMEQMIQKLVSHAKKTEAFAKKSEARLKMLEDAFDEMAQINANQAHAIAALRAKLNAQSSDLFDSDF